MSKTKLYLLNDDGSEEINIFINGFNVDEKKMAYYSSQINSLALKGRVYHLFWSSEGIRIPPMVMTASRYMGKVVKVPVTPQQAVASILIDGGVWLGTEVGKWLIGKKKAEQLGAYLKKHISKIPNAREYPINLIGHSLGARVIHYALACNTWEKYQLQNIILLGGASDANDEEWVDCANEIWGSIFNIYSPNDKVLKLMKPDWEANIGSYPIGNRHTKIKNYKCNYGHRDYIDYINDLFYEKFPKRSRSRIYTGYITGECPWCEEGIVFNQFVETVCSECGTIFSYDPYKEDYKYTKENPEPIEFECPYCEDYLILVQTSDEYECENCESVFEIDRKGHSLRTSVECEVCEGNGTYDCEDCYGTGELDCEDCDGSGVIECYNCEGEGCSECEDTGELDCEDCYGTGRIDCDECDGYGYFDCENCQGKGEYLIII